MGLSVPVARRLLAGLFVLMAPLPMLGPFDACVPPVRYAMLLAASGAVALREGASGPVPGIVALFAVHAAGSVALAWLAAFVLARGLARVRPRTRAALVLALTVSLLAVSLCFELYRTPFGRTPSAGLLGVLG